MVACGSEPEDPYVESEPCLVAEVVSSGTEIIDRREKLATYKRFPSISAYLIATQDRVSVERHGRDDDDGVWRRADLVSEGGLAISCPRRN